MKSVIPSVWGLACLVYGQSTVPRFPADVLSHPVQNKTTLESLIPAYEMARFNTLPGKNTVLLENGYTSPVIHDHKNWPPAGKYTVKEVSMIITKYPVNKEDWRTNYHQLMANRLMELFRIDPSLNDKNIRFRLVLQTDCPTEADAKKLFHGFEIRYQPAGGSGAPQVTGKLKEYLDKNGGTRDISLLSAMGYLDLDSTLIVMDCTGSMDPYMNQVLLWLNENVEGHKYKFALYNDDRSLGRGLGQNGGVITGEYAGVTELMEAFGEMRRTLHHNPDHAENPLEAILRGLRRFPEVNFVLLITDNESCGYDISLTPCVNKPVYVLANGFGIWSNPPLLNLAAQTRGLYYAGADGWIDLSTHQDGRQFDIGRNSYYYSKSLGSFKAVGNFKHHENCMKYYELHTDCPDESKTSPK